jgi:carboxylesterase type B
VDHHLTSFAEDMFHGVNPSNYYIFSSVATVHRMFRFFYENLQNNVLLNSLFIDDLVKEFGTEPKNVNPWGVAAGSFGIASGLAAPLSGPISGGLGVISGAFGVTAAHFKPKTSDYDLKTMLGDYFNQSMIALEDTLADIMGEGDPSKIPMAAQTNFQLQTSVGRFFGDGKFLLNSPNAEYRKVVEESNELLLSYPYTTAKKVSLLTEGFPASSPCYLNSLDRRRSHPHRHGSKDRRRLFGQRTQERTPVEKVEERNVLDDVSCPLRIKR